MSCHGYVDIKSVSRLLYEGVLIMNIAMVENLLDIWVDGKENNRVWAG